MARIRAEDARDPQVRAYAYKMGWEIGGIAPIPERPAWADKEPGKWIVFCECVQKWGYEVVQTGVKDLIPGQRLDPDILIDGWLIIEVDGWQYHGKYLEAWQNDHERDSIFLQHGYLTWRFPNYRAPFDLKGIMHEITLLRAWGKPPHGKDTVPLS